MVGGGITGLVLAWEAHRRGVPVRLYEASERLGGAIETRREEGRVLEGGPDSILGLTPWGVELCRELGVPLVRAAERPRRALIVRNGRLIPLPRGLQLIGPANPLPFLLSPVVSPLGKLRMALDLVLPRRRTEGDETLAGLVVRRLGREALERLAQPLVGGIYGADPERLSLAATMPRLLELERRHGSLLRGLLASGRERSSAGKPSQGGPAYDAFFTPEGGLQSLVERLAGELPRIFTASPLRRLERHGGRWRLIFPGGEEEAGTVALALPAHAAAAVVRGFDADLAEALEGIRYTSSAVVNLVYGRSDVPHRLDAFGFVVPAVEGLRIAACTFSSVKWPGRAPPGEVVLRAFLGGALAPAAGDWEDGEIRRAVVGDLRLLLGIEAEPRAVWIRRHPRAMPMYELGHLDRVARIEGLVARHPGLVVAGSAYRGVGIPDCIRQARQAAEKLAGSREG